MRKQGQRMSLLCSSSGPQETGSSDKNCNRKSVPLQFPEVVYNLWVYRNGNMFKSYLEGSKNPAHKREEL